MRERAIPEATCSANRKLSTAIICARTSTWAPAVAHANTKPTSTLVSGAGLSCKSVSCTRACRRGWVGVGMVWVRRVEEVNFKNQTKK